MLRRILVICILAIGVSILNVGISVNAQELPQLTKKFNSIQFDCEMNVPGQEAIHSKFFMKDFMSATKNMRMEMNMPASSGGGQAIMILNQGKIYMYYPAQGIAMTMSAPNQQMQQQIPKLPQEYAGAVMKIVGQETVDGRLCDVYSITMPKGENFKTWVAKDISFPVKVQANSFTAYYRNIVLDPVLSDSLFQLPAGVKVQDMDNMMKQAQGMMEKYKGMIKQ